MWRLCKVKFSGESLNKHISQRRPISRLPIPCVCVSPSVVSNSCNPMDCSPSGPTVHGILQARILEWVSIPFSRSYSNSQILFLKLSEVGNRLWGSLTGHYCRTMHVSRLCFWDGVPAVSFPCSKFWPCPALIRAQLPEQVAQTASQPTWLGILLLECSLRSLTATSSLLHSQALENNAYECGLPLWMGKTSIFNPGSLCTVQPTTLRH